LSPTGLALFSEDLDALDDLERLILEQLDEMGAVQLPTIFHLKYRKAIECKALLDELLGLSDGGGVGAGGLGGLMGNMASNMLGGAAGDALGGLLGGGDSGLASDSNIELEGDVRIAVDVKFNTLIVSGATQNDLELITDMVEYFDQAGPPHDPNLLGRTYVIPVYFRDPVELKDKIELQLAGLLNKSASNASPENQALQQQQQMLRAMQQLAGGNRRQAAANDPEAEKPVATIGVDEKSQSILVTGPEFIYKEVLRVVEQLDRADINPPDNYRIFPTEGKLDAQLLARQLKIILGDKLIIAEGTEVEPGGPSRQPRPSGGDNQPGGGNRPSIDPQAFEAMRQQAIQRALQNQQFQPGQGQSRRGNDGGDQSPAIIFSPRGGGQGGGGQSGGGQGGGGGQRGGGQGGGNQGGGNQGGRGGR
jgi:hypothetical protein